MSPTTLFDEWHASCPEHMRCTECKGQGSHPDFDEDGACTLVCDACHGTGCECGDDPLADPGHWADHIAAKKYAGRS